MEAWKSFNFDKVWSIDANQTDVFVDVEPIALSCLDGYNACIFAYGQTGSGKTFTMDGSGDKFGVSYRAIQKIFDVLHLRKMQAIKESVRMNKMNSVGKKNHVEGIRSDDINNVAFTETDDDIFNYSITISMLEIYNEQVLYYSLFVELYMYIVITKICYIYNIVIAIYIHVVLLLQYIYI